jgi:hypothetical protein
MKKIYMPYLLILISICFCACQEFLEAKPDRALATPSTLKDIEAILNNNQMNTLYPIAGDIMADDYYLEDNIWNALTDVVARDAYVWATTTYHDFDWQNAYNLIFRANVALDQLEKVTTDDANKQTLRGTALFLRSYNFYQLLQIFTLPYREETSRQELGIPLKLSSDINEPIRRSTLEESYQMVIADLKAAARLLPVTRAFKTQPSKAAAYAQLARTCLVMADAENALLYADSALALQSQLIDYNSLNATAANPFPLFNAEVIFQAFNTGRGGVFLQTRARVDSTLYRSYSANDLRRSLFFIRNSNGSFAFKGDYSGRNTGNLFAGIAVDELYLIKAECQIRANRVAEGLATLNSLLLRRWRTNTFVPLTASNRLEALRLVLLERRKQLLFRSNSRWADIRRLGREPDLAIILQRRIANSSIELTTGDLRFANLIPQNTIVLSGIEQNRR